MLRFFKKRPSYSGFTLIELIIVLSIIAILALLAMPSVLPIHARNQVREALDIADELKDPIKQYYKTFGAFPADNEVAGLPKPQHLIGNYHTDITIANGVMHIQLGNKAVRPLQGKIISVRPILVSASPVSPISWVCGYGSIPDGMNAAGENLTSIEPLMSPVGCRQSSQ